MRALAFVVLFAACSTTPPAVAPAAPAAPAAFAARASVADGRLTVNNDSAVEWTNVMVTLETTALCNIGVVHPNDQGGMNLSNCTGTMPANVSTVRVVADQGQATITLNPPVALGAAPAPTQAAAPAQASAPSTQAAPSQAAPATTEAFKAAGSITGGIGPARRVHVINKNSYTWTGCSVTVNNDYTWALKDMPPGYDEGIMLGRFKDGAGNPLTANVNISSMKVRCNQGSDTVSL